MADVRAHVKIKGRVQGVCFRSYTIDKADQLCLTGWVRNNPDGSVEAVFEGEEEKVKEAVDWCHHGPPNAHVSEVNVDWLPYTGEFSGFTVAYAGRYL